MHCIHSQSYLSAQMALIVIRNGSRLELTPAGSTMPLMVMGASSSRARKGAVGRRRNASLAAARTEGAAASCSMLNEPLAGSSDRMRSCQSGLPLSRYKRNTRLFANWKLMRFRWWRGLLRLGQLIDIHRPSLYLTPVLLTYFIKMGSCLQSGLCKWLNFLAWTVCCCFWVFST